MAWTDPTDWPVGKLVDAAIMNAQIRDNFSFLYDAPACQLTHSTSQSAGSGGEIHVAFDTVVNDPAGMQAAPGDDNINFARTGMWWLSGSVEFDSGLTSTTDAWARINELRRAVGALGATGNYYVSIGGTEHYTNTDFCTFQVNHHSGSAETLAAGPQYGVQWLHG